MRLTHFIVCFAIFSCAGLSHAQESTHPDILYGKTHEVIDVSTTIDGQSYPCAVIINKNATKGGPAILFLHGYGECGTDNERQLSVGLPKHAIDQPELWPFVLIVPQKPIHNSEWEEHEKAVIHFLDEAKAKGLYDPEKLAITGLSQGGHGTMAFARSHSDRFVAAAPVCGYLRPVFTEDRQRIKHPEATKTTPAFIAAAKELQTLPTWFWHGDADSVVSAAESRAIHGALEELDADTRYTELPGVNHNAWDDAYTSDDLSDWFRKRLGE